MDMDKIDMDKLNNNKPKKATDRQTILCYVLAVLALVVIIYISGGLFILLLPWLGLKAMLS